MTQSKQSWVLKMSPLGFSLFTAYRFVTFGWRGKALSFCATMRIADAARSDLFNPHRLVRPAAASVKRACMPPHVLPSPSLMARTVRKSLARTMNPVCMLCGKIVQRQQFNHELPHATAAQPERHGLKPAFQFLLGELCLQRAPKQPCSRSRTARLMHRMPLRSTFCGSVCFCFIPCWSPFSLEFCTLGLLRPTLFTCKIILRVLVGCRIMHPARCPTLHAEIHPCTCRRLPVLRRLQ